MNNFYFQNPTKILFGKDSLDKLGRELKNYGNKILFVYGQESIKKTGLYDKIQILLKGGNFEIFELAGVKSNPVVSQVREGIGLVRKNGVEVLLAVGGGSVIDTAKAIAAGAVVDFDVWEFYLGKAKPEKALPVIAVPTLAASGSEMNGGTVITNEETSQKLGINSEHLYPKISILDPTLTFSVPLNYLAYGMADAISHVFEFYFNGVAGHTELSDSIAEGVLKTIIDLTPKALQNPKDYDIRSNIMWAATIAQSGILAVGTKPILYYLHTIEHAMSGLFNIPHGAGLAVLIPGWITYMAEVRPKKFAQFATNVLSIKGRSEYEVALLGAEKLKEWFKSINCPVSLAEIKISPNNVEKITESALDDLQNVLKGSNEDWLKQVVAKHYGVTGVINIEKLIEIDRKRILNILCLCK